MYDPATKKVQVTRDVVFEENRPWSRRASGAGESYTAPTTSSVVYTTYQGVHEIDRGTPSLSTTPGTPATPATPVSGSSSTGMATSGRSAHGTPQSEQATQAGACYLRWAMPLTHDDGHDVGTGPILYHRLSYILDETEGEREAMERCVLSAEEPANIADALEDTTWKGAMDAEMDSITENRTWELSSLPRGHKAISLTWVYKVKRDPDGKILKHKARLVAKGYAQREGVDFEEVFAPIARMETVCLFLALAVHSSWDVHHMDVKSAFLNGELAEEVYVAQPPGYAVSGKEDQVLKLKKAIYGLR